MIVVLKNSFIQTFFAIDSCMLMELPNDDKQGNLKRHHILLHFEEGKPFKMQLNLRHKATHTHTHTHTGIPWEKHSLSAYSTPNRPPSM